MAIIYAIISFLILAIFIICFCWYKQKKIQEQQEILRARITQANLQNMAIYSRNNDDESSSRKKLTREEILEEFKKQKLKTEKGYQACHFCKNKPGKYKCDCECVVCEVELLWIDTQVEWRGAWSRIVWSLECAILDGSFCTDSRSESNEIPTACVSSECVVDEGEDFGRGCDIHSTSWFLRGFNSLEGVVRECESVPYSTSR